MGDVDRTREHLEVLADALTLPGEGAKREPLTMRQDDLLRWMRRNGAEPMTAERIASGCLAYFSPKGRAMCARDAEALAARGLLARHDGEPPRFTYAPEAA